MASTVLPAPATKRQQQPPQQLPADPHGRQTRRATVHADRDLLTVGRAFQDSASRERHRRAGRSGSGGSGEGVPIDDSEGADDEFDLFCRLANSPTGLSSSPRQLQSSSPRQQQLQDDCLLNAVHWAAADPGQQRSGSFSAASPRAEEFQLVSGGLRQVDEEGPATTASCEPVVEVQETAEQTVAVDIAAQPGISKQRPKSDKQQQQRRRESAAVSGIVSLNSRPRACSTGMATGIGGPSGRDRRPNHSSVKERRSEFRQQMLDQLEPPQQQQQQQQQILRVRSFKRTKHGLVNQGDAVVSGRSNGSLNASSAASSDQELRAAHQAATAAAAAAAAAAERRRSSGGASGASSGHSAAAAAAAAASALCSGGLPDRPCQFYRVQVMGAPRVGKSTLCSQFMSSESQVLNSLSDDDTIDESAEKFVTVLLDADEYHMTFLDTDSTDEPMGTIVMDVDAYMIVFAVDSRRSFGFAKQIFNDLVSEARKSAALILVANKSDLVRNRDVTHDEAKNLASVYGAKYIEISTALNHNVDELLVSILSQIRVQLKRIEKEKCKLLSRQKDGRGLRASLRLRSPRQALGNFFRKHFSSKSCEDLEPPNQQAQ